VQRTTRKRLPFGIGQIGKSFRNEITPGNFIFRIREFEQMELEFFCAPAEEMQWFHYWKDFCHKWLLSLGLTDENIKLRDHDPEELSHYSNATTDIEYLFPFGWGELWGIADRTNFDLKQHQNTSGESLEYIDPVTNEKFLPYCIEPSLGADRVTLAFLCDAYDEQQLENDTRVVLHLSPVLAPFKAAVLPLQKQLNDKAQEVYDMLLKEHMVDFDTTGSIGKRYRRQDEIGTPCCITVDFDTLETGTVTVRDRDTMQQTRMEIGQLSAYIADMVKF
jgi:glycyl-tRNA synthetase